MLDDDGLHARLYIRQVSGKQSLERANNVDRQRSTFRVLNATASVGIGKVDIGMTTNVRREGPERGQIRGRINTRVET